MKELQTPKKSIDFKRQLKILGQLAVVVLISACNMATTGDLYEGVGYRESRFSEILAMRKYRACVDEAKDLGAKAREENDISRYLTSARLLEQCESKMSLDAKHITEEERMRAYALNIQNYFKGSDVAKARGNLEIFKKTFEGRDLYYADGSSFINTMDLLSNTQAEDDLTLINVSHKVRSEIRRISYWKKN
jgi:hypothetical protein